MKKPLSSWKIQFLMAFFFQRFPRQVYFWNLEKPLKLFPKNHYFLKKSFSVEKWAGWMEGVFPPSLRVWIRNYFWFSKNQWVVHVMDNAYTDIIKLIVMHGWANYSLKPREQKAVCSKKPHIQDYKHLSVTSKNINIYWKHLCQSVCLLKNLLQHGFFRWILEIITKACLCDTC